MENKKGISNIAIFFFIFVCFFALIFLGLTLYSFKTVSSFLDIDVDVGQVNLGDINENTFGAMTAAFESNADYLGLAIIFGMIISMLLNAFFFGDKNIFWIPVDIIILIAAILLSVYISSAYQTVITNFTIIDTFTEDLSKSSTFLLNLPIYVGTIGVLLMIATYSKFKRKTQPVLKI